MIRNFLKNDQLYLECLNALGAKPLDDEKSDLLHELFKKMYPLTEWGKIEWDKIEKKKKIDDLNEIIPTLKELLQTDIDKSVYIEWSDGGLPIIKANLINIIKNFDEVDCVSFDKFIFNPSQSYVVEVLFSGQITVGVLNKN
jgi:hypothetical protein